MAARRKPNKTRTVAAQIEVTVPPALVEQLQQKYPILVPKLDQSEREIFEEVGFQRCIKLLATLVKRNDRSATKNRQVPDASGHT